MAAEIDTRPLLPAQLDYFTKDNTHAKPAAFFNPHFFNSPATAEEEIKVGIAIDVGGSMLSWASFHKVNGRLIQSAETVFEPSQEGGRNYLQLLEELRERIGSLAVGISTTGSVMGTVLDRTNNLPGFFMDLKTKYNGDFA